MKNIVKLTLCLVCGTGKISIGRVQLLDAGFGVGKLGEYNVQRYANYLQCYGIMSASCIVMVVEK